MPTETPPATVIPASGARVTGGLEMTLLARALAGPLTTALGAVGEKEVAAIKADLNVPVEVDDRGHVTRSSPGERPRKEFGVLQENVDYHVEPGNGTELPTLVISSSRPPISAGDDPDAPAILEFELNRPYMLPALVRLKGYARDDIAKFFESK